MFGSAHLRLSFLVLLIGSGWGLTQPLSKIAVSTGHDALVLVFWQLIIGAVLLSTINIARGKVPPIHRKALLLYLFIAVMGTLLPNWASYTAIKTLPSGVMSIIIASVAMFSFPIALLLRIDHFSTNRLIGLTLGLLGVACIALPESGLPETASTLGVILALGSALCYAIEGNIVAKFGTVGIEPLVVLQGASIVGALFAAPMALSTGHGLMPPRPLGAPEMALIAVACIHAMVYSLYVWLVGKAGAVFAAQTSTLITGAGVLWSMLLLKESYSGWVWAAFALMLLSLTLVQPRLAASESDSIAR